MPADLHYLSLDEVARRLKARELSSVETTSSLLDRIAKVDRQLGSYATVTAEQALTDAAQKIAGGQPGVKVESGGASGELQSLIDTFNRVEIMNVLGRHADALAAGRALLPRMVEATGADHPFALETEDAIGLALTQLGQAAQALPMHRRTLELKTRMMAAETPYALISQEYLARALLALGRRDEALALLQPLLDARMRMLGADHQRTRTARELLAKATSN